MYNILYKPIQLLLNLNLILLLKYCENWYNGAKEMFIKNMFGCGDGEEGLMWLFTV